MLPQFFKITTSRYKAVSLNDTEPGQVVRRVISTTRYVRGIEEALKVTRVSLQINDSLRNVSISPISESEYTKATGKGY